MLASAIIVRDPSGAWVDPKQRPQLHQMTVAEIKRYDVGRLRPGSDYAKRHPDQQQIDGERVPTLDEVITLFLDRCPPPTRLVVEIKTDPTNPSFSAPPELVADIQPVSEMDELIFERTGAQPGTVGGFFKLNPKVDDVPDRIRTFQAERPLAAPEEAREMMTLSELEHRYLQRVLALVGGNKSRAARVLGLDRRTLYRMLDRERGEQGGRESSVQLGERHEHHH